MSIVSTPHNSVLTGFGDWKAVFKAAIRDLDTLCQRLELAKPPLSDEAAQLFPVFVPEPYLRRIAKGDLQDPLLKQVWPAPEENHQVPGFNADPVGDLAAEQLPGLLQKYQGRALMVTSGACAVHCRYCFRRHYPYDQVPRSLNAWQPLIDSIANDHELHEVLLSGGDPLTIVDTQLGELARRLSAIPHLKRLRIHSRLPIMIPQRINDELLSWLTGTRLTPWMVIHCNHANEIDGEVAAAIGRLVDAGVPVLNQAVLLKGVNDSVESLEVLSNRLIDLRVTPYYLHQLDKVAGAAHFEVGIETGRQLIKQLQARLPGYAVPRYVIEEAGQASKTWL